MDLNEKNCIKCKEKLSGDIKICDGVCAEYFHKKCLGLTKTVLKALEENNNLTFVCNDCKSNSLKSISDRLKKIFSTIHIHQERELRIESKCNDIDKDIKKINESVESKCNDIVKELKTINEKICEKDNSNETQNQSESSKPNYAEVLKSNSSIIIKPLQSGGKCDTTLEAIKEIVDPMLVSNVINLTSGAVRVECKSNESVLKLSEIVNEKLSENYSVKVSKQLKPKIKIVGISVEYEACELGKKN